MVSLLISSLPSLFVTSAAMCSEDREMESVPLGLGCWRDAVSTASSAAQVTLCCNQLDQCIAWEKSIMKVVSGGRLKLSDSYIE